MEGRLSAFEYWQRRQKVQRWAQKIIRWPFVRKVSLAGSMATGEATKQSDIDLFIQVEEGNLWWIRLAITLWVHLAGERRTDTSISNKLCLNWWATFDGPVTHRRPHIVLTEQSHDRFMVSWFHGFAHPTIKQLNNETIESMAKIRSKVLFERFLRPVTFALEFFARNIQQHRFANDQRTHSPGSQVRFTNHELGFHPPKMF